MPTVRARISSFIVRHLHSVRASNGPPSSSLTAMPLDVVVHFIAAAGVSFATQLQVAHALSLVCIDFATIVQMWLSSIRCISRVGLRTSSGAFQRALTHLHSVTSLRLTSEFECDDVTLDHLSHHCPMLTQLDLRGCNRITDAGIATLARGCTRLASIDVSRCFQLTEVSVEAMSRCVHLTSLNVASCYKVTNVVALFATSPVVVCECAAFTNTNETHQTNSTNSTTPTTRRIQLTTLNISGLNTRLLTELDIVAVVSACTCLTTLDVSRVSNLTNFAMAAIARSCSYLSHLDISCCCRVTDIGIGALAKCTLLETLHMGHLFKITDASLAALGSQCTRLHTLHLPYCSQVRDVGSAVHAWPHLTSLDATQVTALTDTSVVAIAKHCPRLKSIHLAQCFSVTDIGALALACCSSLTLVDLAQCWKLTDNGVVAMTTTCTRLVYLRLVECTRLTQKSVSAISRCSQLRTLDLAQCYGMNGWRLRSHLCVRARPVTLSSMSTSISVTATSTTTRIRKLRRCVNLTSLNLSDMHRLTNSDMHAVAQSCVHLTHLNLCYCSRLTDGAVVVVATHCTELVSLQLLGCHRLQGTYVTALLRCTHLTSLQLPEHTADDVVHMIKERCTRLAYLLSGCHVVHHTTSS